MWNADACIFLFLHTVDTDIKNHLIQQLLIQCLSNLFLLFATPYN